MRIMEIVLQSNRLDEMKSFYSELLGFCIKQASAEAFTIATGESKITFQKNVTDLGAYYHFAFTIPSNKLTESIQWLQHKGISCFSTDRQNQFFFPAWNATAAYFYDPDGNLVEFIAHHSLHNPSETPFSENSILYISEIGLPVPHVAESSKHICEAFEQEIWRKDEKQFAAVGDVEGLFILIETSRLWFPDERIPGVFPTQVTIQGELDNQVQLTGLPYQLWSTAKVPMEEI
ncbi:glyoxalase [Brevibacillus laterosporus]|uniref:VOC family protein n=1 Tax=Brevibacillus laterosporus TaxID=1465 RepID=UPI000C78EA9B|nr:VOC family protein [Brevibacillus laterosporus]AUM65001.1 glyoxalase [Brevibacillus laterosporus]